jgi:hypothetical protein
MDFIFMLTRHDATVSDALQVMDAIEPLHLRHIGFKDVGVPHKTLRELHARIKESGAHSYLEVVSTSRERALTSVCLAADLRVDYLLGGIWIEETLRILDGSGIGYLPFVGRPEGHPTRLHGTPASIAEDCRRARELGCAGVDLLAYRAEDAHALDLVKAARSALTGRLVVAGSVERTEQLAALQHAGADAFTIGSAVFAGAINPDAGLLTTQLRTVVSDWLTTATPIPLDGQEVSAP